MNSDGKQQTLTGYHTTHHTTSIVLQTNQLIEKTEFKTMIIKKFQKEQEPIPSFSDFHDKYANSTLLDIDLLIVLHGLS